LTRCDAPEEATASTAICRTAAEPRVTPEFAVGRHAEPSRRHYAMPTAPCTGRHRRRYPAGGALTRFRPDLHPREVSTLAVKFRLVLGPGRLHRPRHPRASARNGFSKLVPWSAIFSALQLPTPNAKRRPKLADHGNEFRYLDRAAPSKRDKPRSQFSASLSAIGAAVRLTNESMRRNPSWAVRRLAGTTSRELGMRECTGARTEFENAPTPGPAKLGRAYRKE
jgi:hypothetical protein